MNAYLHAQDRLVRYGLFGLNSKVEAAREALRAVQTELHALLGTDMSLRLPVSRVHDSAARERYYDKQRGRGLGAYRVKKAKRETWKAKAQYQGRAVHLGNFPTREAAMREYRKFWMSPTAWFEDWDARQARKDEYRKTGDASVFHKDPLFKA